MRLDDGRMTQSAKHVARVRKPLMSVSSVNDKGNIVLFDEKGSFIIPGEQRPCQADLRFSPKSAGQGQTPQEERCLPHEGVEVEAGF